MKSSRARIKVYASCAHRGELSRRQGVETSLQECRLPARLHHLVMPPCATWHSKQEAVRSQGAGGACPGTHEAPPETPAATENMSTCAADSLRFLPSTAAKADSLASPYASMHLAYAEQPWCTHYVCSCSKRCLIASAQHDLMQESSTLLCAGHRAQNRSRTASQFCRTRQTHAQVAVVRAPSASAPCEMCRPLHTFHSMSEPFLAS